MNQIMHQTGDHNKNRQFAPAGPDANTAARFRRRRCKR
jgi:hypothetical protein